MKTVFVMALLMAVNAHALEVGECMDVFKKASEDPRALSLAELDDVRVCAANMYSDRVNAKKSMQELRALERNFGAVTSAKPKLESVE